MYFMRGDIISLPTAANENSIKASWLIILGVWNDGLGVPFSTCYIWNIGSSTWETRFGVVLAVVLSALRFSFNFFPQFSIFVFCFSFVFGVYFSHSPLVTL